MYVCAGNMLFVVLRKISIVTGQVSAALKHEDAYRFEDRFSGNHGVPTACISYSIYGNNEYDLSSLFLASIFELKMFFF